MRISYSSLQEGVRELAEEVRRFPMRGAAAEGRADQEFYQFMRTARASTPCWTVLVRSRRLMNSRRTSTPSSMPMRNWKA